MCVVLQPRREACGAMGSAGRRPACPFREPPGEHRFAAAESCRGELRGRGEAGRRRRSRPSLRPRLVPSPPLLGGLSVKPCLLRTWSCQVERFGIVAELLGLWPGLAPLRPCGPRQASLAASSAAWRPSGRLPGLCLALAASWAALAPLAPLQAFAWLSRLRPGRVWG